MAFIKDPTIVTKEKTSPCGCIRELDRRPGSLGVVATRMKKRCRQHPRPEFQFDDSGHVVHMSSG